MSVQNHEQQFYFNLHARNFIPNINEQTALYLTNTIRFFALRLVSTFLPVYIFILSKDNGVFSSNSISNGIVWALLSKALISGSTLFFIYILHSVIFEKLNFIRSIFVAIIIQMVELILFTIFEGRLNVVMLLHLLVGARITLYWIPYHIFFTRKFHSKNHKYGQKVSIRIFLATIAAAIAPLFGGFLVENLGFGVLFITGLLSLSLSVIPLWLTVHEWKHKKHSIRNLFKKYILNPKYKKLTISFYGESIKTVVLEYIWPIALFVGLQSYIKFGAINTVAFILSSILTLYIGKIIDKYTPKFTLLLNTVFSIVNNILRIIFHTPLALYIVEIAGRLNAPLHTVPALTYLYEKAERNEMEAFIVYREIVLHTTAVFASLGIAGLIIATGTWRWSFAFAAISALFIYQMATDKN